MDRISMHHIGGRGGDRAIDIPPKFHKDIINIFYEADPDCLAQIEEANKKLESETRVFPYCLSDSCKPITFNANYDPFTSSIYDITPYYNSYYTFSGVYDYIISETSKVMEKRSMDAVSMDSIASSIPAPDFLSIDTQGSEYDILVGAKEALKSSVLAIKAETLFHPINSSGIIFGDLVNLLSSQGFHFVRFTNVHESSPFRFPIGLRGDGFHMAADVLFLRKVENTEDLLMLRKLAFLSIVLNQFEYGLQCLQKSKHFPYPAEPPTYLKFLGDLGRAIGELPAVYPFTFTSLYPSFEDSKARFNNGRKPQLAGKPVDAKVETQGWTGVETVLNGYGLEKQANSIKRNRHIQARSVARVS